MIITDAIINEANQDIENIISHVKQKNETQSENIQGRAEVLATLHMISEAKSVIEKKHLRLLKKNTH